MITLQFTGPVNNDSLQIGDMAYFQTPSPSGGFLEVTPPNVPIFIGPVTAFTETTVTIDDVNPGGTIPQSGDFLMFGKDSSMKLSGIVGYYASVTLKNNSTEKAEMYCLASEITPSSK